MNAQVSTLSADQARAARLRALLLAGPATSDPSGAADPSGRPDRSPGAAAPGAAVLGVATWFGALQGQDVRSLLWSLGVRLPGLTEPVLRAAFEERTVLRTWPMRGTLHLVPALDARWMTELMASRTATAEATRRRQLGLTEADADRATDVLGAALAGGNRLTREQCVAALDAAGIPVAGQAGYHLVRTICQRGVACMAPEVGPAQTFALLDEWAPGQRTPGRDEALAIVALRYVRSHGPVPRRDLAGWTGLTLADVDRGVAGAGEVICRVRVDGVEMLAHAPTLDAGPARADHLVLPGFDEFVLGYKDRSLVLTPEHFQAVVPGGNGVFQSTLVRRGQVVGLWKRTITRGRALIDATALEPLTQADRTCFEAAFDTYAAFVEVSEVRVTWS